MGFRATLILIGLVLVLGSWFFGDWAIWLGAPIFFLGVVFQFLDLE